MYFHYFAIISSLKKRWPFILRNLNSLHSWMLCVQFGWNWPRGPWKENENGKSLQKRLQWWTKDNFLSEKLTWIFRSDELGIVFLVQRHLWRNGIQLCCSVIQLRTVSFVQRHCLNQFIIRCCSELYTYHTCPQSEMILI